MIFVEQLLTIARNTCLECIRQPITLIVVLVSVLMVLLSNQFSAFTMSDDQRMFVDIGLSTIFMAGALLAAFLATSVLDQEITNKTVLMVVSKPVSRSAFVLGKYLGVLSALLASIAVPSMGFFIVEVHGVIQTAATPVGWPYVIFGTSALAVTIAIATWCNYFYNKSFGAIVVVLGGPLLLLAYGLCLFFDVKWEVTPPATEFRLELWAAFLLMAMALAVLTAIAVAVSTRWGQVATIGMTIGLLLMGLLSDWVLGRRIHSLETALARLGGTGGWAWDADHLSLAALKAGYAIVPNFQVFWVVDAVNQNQPIPWEYFQGVFLYGLLMTTAALAVAVAMFQRREVG